jgi:hypothetical protein
MRPSSSGIDELRTTVPAMAGSLCKQGVNEHVLLFLSLLLKLSTPPPQQQHIINNHNFRHYHHLPINNVWNVFDISMLTRSEIGIMEENKITNRKRVSIHKPPPPFKAVITPLRTMLMMNSSLALAFISSSHAPVFQSENWIDVCEFGVCYPF